VGVTIHRDYKKADHHHKQQYIAAIFLHYTMKYAIVTGASPSSIGFYAARKLASYEFGYKVIVACRSEDKGLQAVSLIRSYDPTSQVVYMNLDLSSLASIQQFVTNVHTLDECAISKQYGLQLLVNNAGIGFGRNNSIPYTETADGIEQIVGVNHFGTFLLTNLLLEDLKLAGSIKEESNNDGAEACNTTPARVVTVSSSLHDGNRFSSKKAKVDDGDNTSTTAIDEDSSKKIDTGLILPDFPNGLFQSKGADDGAFDSYHAYRTSKLCNLWFTYELQRRLDEESSTKAAGGGDCSSAVVANAVSPGFIPTTGLTRHSGWLGLFFLQYILDPWRYIGFGITRSPEDGGEVIVQACTSAAAERGGQYFQLPKGKDASIEAIPSSDESMDIVKAKILWDLSIKTCKL
jgi:NAD(P)-dependent dehydrogenase (short-subunit alcohol dehydrogenase family)